MENSNSRINFLTNMLDLIDKMTWHGIPNVFRSEQNYKKIIWIIFAILSISFCIFLINLSILNYLSFDHVTNVDIIYEQPMTFPTISMCSISDKNRILSRVINSCIFNNENCLHTQQYFTTIEFNKLNLAEKCKDYCPLECDTIIYTGSLSFYLNKKNDSIIRLKIYFRELRYFLIDQQPKMESIDLISAIGGLFGLCLGASFLSFIEILEILIEIANFSFKTINLKKLSNFKRISDRLNFDR